MKIQKYQSTHSLSYYNIGNVYSFYVHNFNPKKFTIADKKTIKKYSSTLNEFINNIHPTDNHTPLTISRIIGIVVDKHESTDRKDIDKITVMFKTDTDNYILIKYIVNSHDIFTNTKDFTLPYTVFHTV